MQAPRFYSRLLLKNFGKRNYETHGHHPVTTYNDLPTPQGNWKTHYDANQRKHNSLLVGGIGALVGSILAGKAFGFLEFHNDIPARPAVIASYK